MTGGPRLRIEVVDTDRLPERAASTIADLLSEAVERRGVASLAVSGGRTPERMLRALATRPVPWEHVHVFQVDERVAPAGDPARNLVQLEGRFVAHLATPLAGLHPIPVEDPAGPDAAARRYEATLQGVTGLPPTLDVVHLGLGDDGHTASLVPHDPALDVADREVTATGDYRGHRRVTLTLPCLTRARARILLVDGAAKRDALAGLRRQDPDLPASAVAAAGALVLADPAAAGSDGS